MCPDRSTTNPPPDPIRVRLDFGERIDPAAADALWRIVLGASSQRPDQDKADGRS